MRGIRRCGYAFHPAKITQAGRSTKFIGSKIFRRARPRRAVEQFLSANRERNIETNRMQQHKNAQKNGPERATVRIAVTEGGPYLVYGRPPLSAQYILPDDENHSWYFQEGRHFSTENEPTALCRCGGSHRHPYCDGHHETRVWDSRLTAPAAGRPEKITVIEGPTLELFDAPGRCVFARFCHHRGDTWALTRQSDRPEARRQAIRGASICPGGRLTARDRQSRQFYEFRFEPSLGLIEDDAIGASGGLWVRGGIPVLRPGGTQAEVRNRVVLCRCGLSRNKPYCDGTHAAAKWRDGLENAPVGETLPEEVY